MSEVLVFYGHHVCRQSSLLCSLDCLVSKVRMLLARCDSHITFQNGWQIWKQRYSFPSQRGATHLLVPAALLEITSSLLILPDHVHSRAGATESRHVI